MKAVQTIGWKKGIQFLWWNLMALLINACMIPQMRVILLRLCGARIGKSCVIMRVVYTNVHHYGFSRLHIGNYCYIGDDVLLDMRGNILLADHVTISSRANIVCHMNVGYPDHPLQHRYPTYELGVSCEQGVYIGTAATILPGVILHENSVVAAGSVVTTSVPKNSMVAGVPAIVKKRWKEAAR